MRSLRPKVDFVGCRTAERHVRSMLVIPEAEPIKFTTKGCSPQGNDNLSRALVLDGQDQSLHHGNAAVFADGTVAGWLDDFSFYPAPERIAIEDTVPVADDVLWRSSCLTDRLAQQTADGAAVGPIGEDPDLHDPP